MKAETLFNTLVHNYWDEIEPFVRLHEMKRRFVWFLNVVFDGDEVQVEQGRV